MPPHPYSDLEVAPGTAPRLAPPPAPEVAPEVAPSNAPEVLPGYKSENNAYVGSTPLLPSGGQRLICGLKPKTFWVVLGITVAVIIGGIAGGVAGGLQSRSKAVQGSPDQDTTPTGSSSIMSTSQTTSATSAGSPSVTSASRTTTSTQRLSTTTVILPSVTLLRDCPSSNGTLYDVDYEDGEAPTFRKFCTAGLQHVLNGVDVINERTLSLNDCIDSCIRYNDINKTAIAVGENQTCNAVCWRNNEQLDNINQIPGQCFGFTTGNTSAGFKVTREVLCDSAGWINQRFL